MLSMCLHRKAQGMQLATSVLPSGVTRACKFHVVLIDDLQISRSIVEALWNICEHLCTIVAYTYAIDCRFWFIVNPFICHSH